MEPHDERRLTTILSVDVVGYSRLMAADDPKWTLARTGSVIPRGVPSTRETTIGTVFHQEISLMKGQIVIYRTSLGSRSSGVANCATVAGNR